MKKLFIFIIIINFFSCNVPDNVQTSNKIKGELQRLRYKNYNEAWVIITSEPSNKFLQFFSSGNIIYFEIPIRSEIKNKYIENNLSLKIDSAGTTTSFIPIMTNKEMNKLKIFLNEYDIKYITDRQSFIEPSIFNQTDTTGWVTRIVGELNIESNKYMKFIDSYFENVYEIDLDVESYKIETN